MSIYLINGPSGSGKTTIGSELQKRGFRVIDTDEEFGHYANLDSGKEVKFPNGSVTEIWYSQNEWVWDKSKVKEVFDNATETIFFCGGASNENIFYPHFQKIFRLIVDADTLVQRIKDRGVDPHTNNPVFIAKMLKFLESAKSDGEEMGMVVIDTTNKSVGESTDELLSFVKE